MYATTFDEDPRPIRVVLTDRDASEVLLGPGLEIPEDMIIEDTIEIVEVDVLG